MNGIILPKKKQRKIFNQEIKEETTLLRVIDSPPTTPKQEQ